MLNHFWQSFGILLLSVLSISNCWAADAEVLGAGSSFAAPIIGAWAKQFQQDEKIEVTYRSVGSGEGVRRVTARAVDFGMTDVPLTQSELVQDDLMQFPLVVGAIVPVVNLPGMNADDLKLSGKVLADIYLGKINTWDAAEIRSLNPELKLPNLPIKVVHRSDGSGTSFVFTHYLSKVNAEWQSRLGIGSRLRWPAGIGAQGNEGVSDMVRVTTGAIGYVQLSHALKNQLATVQLSNKTGKFVNSSESAVRSALVSANWSRASFYEMPTDRDGENSWPIVGTAFVLIHKNQDSRDDALETLRFLQWIYNHGAPFAKDLHYVSFEDQALLNRIRASWKEVKDNKGQAVWNMGK